MRHLPALTVALWAAVSAAPALAQKTPDTRLDTDPAGMASSVAPQMAVSGSSVYVTWQDARNGGPDIYFNRSLDGGTTWLSSDVRLDTDLPGAALSESPQIASSGSSVYVTWEDYRQGGSDIYFNRSLDGGTTWLSSDVRVNTGSPGATSAHHPRIASSGPSVYVTWEGTRGRGSNIYFNRSLDGGATWQSSDVQLNMAVPGQPSRGGPQIAVSGAAIYVVWWDSRNVTTREDIYFNRSLDGGVTWLSREVRLDTDGAGAGRSTFPDLAAAGASIYVVWKDQRAGGYPDIHFNRSLDGGVTWLSRDVRIDTDTAGAAASLVPQVAAIGSSVYVTWVDARHAGAVLGSDIYFSRSLDAGLTWLSSDVRLNTNAAGSASCGPPRIAASDASVYVAWSDGRNGVDPHRLGRHGDVYFNRSSDRGARWLAGDIRLNTSPAGSASAGVSDLAASGTSVYLTWQDTRSAPVSLPHNSDIYFNIPFGFLSFGGAKAGSGAIAPQLASAGLATIGSTPSLDVTDGLGAAPGALLLGAEPASKIALPVLGGTLLVSPALAFPIVLGGTAGVPGAGTASFPLPIPDDPAAIGANFNFQVLLLDPGAAWGLSMTGGVEFWIG